jgi:hypothetical protein
MACPDRLSQWSQEVSTAFGHLSKPQVWGLVLWSAGIALTGAAGITQISALLALVLNQQEQTVFQRLREWYLDASHKSGSKQGKKRRDLDITTCFTPLLRWVVRLWGSEEKRLPLVVDATSLGNRWTVLAVSVVLSGGAIPVAWKVLRAEEEGSWRPHWEQLFADLQGAIPSDWFVIVLADRGLYARWMWDGIRDCGWHPFLRINLGVKASLAEADDFDWISRWVAQPGTHWAGVVDCFVSKSSRLRATLLLHWEPGYEAAWAIVTDLDPAEAQVSWYRLRTWIEGGFKDFKRGLWGWQHSKMTRASCVERLWLAMALAQLWCLSVGTLVEQQGQQQALLPLEERLPETHVALRKRQHRPAKLTPRRLSCVARGRLHLLAMTFLGQPLLVGRLFPEAWPETIEPPQKHLVPALHPGTKTPRDKARRRRQKQRAYERSKARP